MIIKTNLATKPTHNHSLYVLGCVLLAAIAVVFTTYNLTNLISSFEKTAGLNAKIAEQQKARSQAQSDAAALRARIAAIKTPEFVSETEFLNTAIKRRVFSWTALFDQFEQVFPDNVRMVSVTPSIDGEEIGIKMDVTGRDLNAIVELINVLQSSPAFSHVMFKGEKQEKDGSLQASITLRYKPELLPTGSGGNEPTAPDSQQPADNEEKEL
jgi:hypothetical protein